MFNTGSQGDMKNKTWEASTLTGVLREQTRRDKNNLPVSSTCCRLNTDHKDVAMLHEFWPHLYILESPEAQMSNLHTLHIRSVQGQGKTKGWVLGRHPWTSRSLGDRFVQTTGNTLSQQQETTMQKTLEINLKTKCKAPPHLQNHN